MTKTQNKSLDLAGQSKMEKAARAELEALYRSKDEDPDPSEWERREVERPSRQMLRQMQRRMVKMKSL